MKVSPLNPKRRAIATGLMLALAGGALPAWAAPVPGKLRIGYQKAASTLVLLRAHGSL
jgi:sulfonate transport system substrate-binding protein